MVPCTLVADCGADQLCVDISTSVALTDGGAQCESTSVCVCVEPMVAAVPCTTIFDCMVGEQCIDTISDLPLSSANVTCETTCVCASEAGHQLSAIQETTRNADNEMMMVATIITSLVCLFMSHRPLPFRARLKSISFVWARMTPRPPDGG